MAKNEGARASKDWYATSLCPDVCKTPPHGTPIPYSIIGYLSDESRESNNVRFTSKATMTMYSRITKVSGNEPGSMGGVKSGVNKNYCRPTSHSSSVKVNGHYVLYKDGTKLDMNCAGAEGPANTIGKLRWSGSTKSVEPIKDGRAKSSPSFVPETEAEKSFLVKLTSTSGIQQFAGMAPKLLQTNWSNPTTLLGALPGFAKLGGLKSFSKYTSMAQQAQQFAKNGLSNPQAWLSSLGTTSSITGAKAGQLASQWGGQFSSLLSADFGNSGSILNTAQNVAGMTGLNPLASTEDQSLITQTLSSGLPMLSGLSETLWKPTQYIESDFLSSTSIENGLIVGEGSPRILPENSVEVQQGMSKMMFNNIQI